MKTITPTAPALLKVQDGPSYSTCKRHLEALVARACSQPLGLALGAVEEIRLLLRSSRHTYHAKKRAIEKTPANKIKCSMGHLRGNARPFQVYFDDVLRLSNRAYDNSKTNAWRFPSLAFFHDRHIPFARVLSAEALSIIAGRALYPEVARAAFNVLRMEFLKAAAPGRVSRQTSRYVFIACARALALLACDDKSTGTIAPSQVVRFLAIAASACENQATLAARDGLKQLAFENASLFRDARCLNMLVSAARRKVASRQFFFELFMYLAVNDLAAFGRNPSALRRIEDMMTADDLHLWKHFAYFAAPLFKGDVSPAESNDRLAELREGDKSCLILHNIREALGDEWIRNGQLMESLLQLNPSIKITIVTDRPWLYRHPRVTAVSINEPDVRAQIENVDYAFVANQYYLSGSHSEELQVWAAATLRKRVAVYIETVVQTNYYCPGFATLYLESARFNVMEHAVPDNVYAPFLHLAAELGLPHSKSMRESVLNGTNDQAAQHWIDLNIRSNGNARGRRLMIYNPFGGTYEHKGYMRTELDIPAAFVLKSIGKGYFVILPPCKGIPWGNVETALSIRDRLPEELRRYCLLAGTPDENPRLLIELIAVVDKVVSIEGGLTHLACHQRKPVDIIIKRDAKQTNWLPIERTGQKETSTLKKTGFGATR